MTTEPEGKSEVSNHQLINQTSGEFEYYTDLRFVNAAREVMGSIDLDPASSFLANQRIQADKYYTVEDDGLAQPWFGNIFMNHPFHKGEEVCGPNCKKKACPIRGYHCTKRIPSNMEWINKADSLYRRWEFRQLICITFAATSEAWFQPLLKYPQCFLSPRTNYLLPDGTLKKGVTKGSVITYMGVRTETFKEIFSQFGTVK